MSRKHAQRFAAGSLGAALFLVTCGMSAGGKEELTPEECFTFIERILSLPWGPPVSLQRAKLTCRTWEEAWSFVKERIRYVPYDGCVRGAFGTCACGAGNSLDRALLLGALLEDLGFSVRICGAEAPAGLQRPITPFPRGDSTPFPYAEVSRLTGVGEEALRGYVAAEKASWKRTMAFLLGRAEARYRQIKQALQEAPAVPQHTVPQREAMHFWVSFEKEPGRWVDLDPTAGAQPGTRVAEATVRFPPSDVPKHLNAVVRFSLHLEGEELLRVERPACDLHLKCIQVAFLPGDLSFLTSLKDLKAVLAAYQKTERFYAVVGFGPEVFTSRQFDLTGRVFQKAGGGRIEAARRVGSTVGGLFGGGPEEAEKKPKAKWAVRLRVVATYPGGSRTEERVVLRSGTPRHTRLRLLSTGMYLVLPGAVHPDVVNRMLLETIREGRDLLLDIMAGKFSLEKDWSRFRRQPAELFAFARLERALLSYLPPEARVYLPLHVLGWEERVDESPSGKEGELAVQAGFDILFAPVLSGLRGPERFDLGLRWGTMLTEAERLICEVRSETPPLSASEDFFRAQAEGIGVRVLTAARDLRDLSLPDELAARLKEEFRAGNVVVLPERAFGPRPISTYFAVNVRTGETLGKSSSGRGQATSEYAEQVALYLRNLGAMSSFADFTKCLFGTILMPLTGASRVEIGTYFCFCFIKWGFNALVSAAGDFAGVEASWSSIAVDIGVGGVPFSDFGGLAGPIGTYVGRVGCVGEK